MGPGRNLSKETGSHQIWGSVWHGRGYEEANLKSLGLSIGLSVEFPQIPSYVGTTAASSPTEILRQICIV